MVVLAPVIVLACGDLRAFLIIPALGLALLGGAALKYWFFRFQLKEDRVLIRKGVLKRHLLDLPFDRIQGVRVERSLIDRLLRLVSVSLDTAGNAMIACELPSVSKETAEWVSALYSSLRWHHCGYHHDDDGIAVRSGRIVRSVKVVLFRKVQAVRLKRSPLQRRAGLAILKVGMASGDVTNPSSFTGRPPICAITCSIELSRQPWQDRGERGSGSDQGEQKPLPPSYPDRASASPRIGPAGERPVRHHHDHLGIARHPACEVGVGRSRITLPHGVT